MPQIRQFDTPALGLRPTETGIETVAGNARRVGAFFNQQAGATEQLASDKGAAFGKVGNALGSGIAAAGDAYVNYLDHKEISAGAAKGTELMATLTDAWNKKISDPKLDPNDPTIKAKFMQENLEPALQQFKDDSGYFTTDKSQQFAESFIDRFRQHMSDKASADMSTLAGIALKRNVETTVNSLSSMVASDPSSLDFALKSVDHAIDAKVGSAPTLDATTAASVRSEVGLKARENIVKSAIIGMIQKNPNVDLDAIQKKYGDYVNGAEMKMFQKTAQAQSKADLYYQRQSETIAKQHADLAVHKGADDIMANSVSVDQNGRLMIAPDFLKKSLDLARNNPDAPSAAATVRTMIDWAESQQNKDRKVATDPVAASTLDGKMFASENPTSKMDILKAEAAGKLTRADAEIRTKIIDQRDKVPTDPQFKFAMDGAKELIEGRTAGEKSMQSGKYAAFMQEFLQEYQRQKAAGTLPPNALSLRDPNSLLSKSMEAYKSPLAAAISGNGGVTPAPTPSNVPRPATTPSYQPGDVVNTSEGPRRFKGGNFRDKANWEPIS